MKRRFIIACGGTGGHLFPGLAVAEVLHQRGHEILLLVSEKEIDATALKAHPQFQAEKLPSVGMPSTILSPALVGFLRRCGSSYSQCRAIIKKWQPDAVLGMGGFTSTAPIIAARFKGIPCFVHESNAIPGRANKLAARFTDNVLLGFDGCRAFFPGAKCVVTGTPVRANLGSRLDRTLAMRGFGLDPAKPVLLVTGGSQGAGGINQILFRCAPFFASSGVQIIHLTGKNDDRLAAANYQREGIPHFVAPFHHRMEEAYSVADLVVSRAGASSLGELSRFGLPSILIPYPYATDDHQRANAQIFSTAGAAIVCSETEVVPEVFAAMVSNLLGDGTRRSQMARQALAQNPVNAAGKVAEILENASRKENT